MEVQSPTRKRRRVVREAEILAAARELLESRGLVGTSVANVAELAHVSEATVFSYFKTRRELMARVIHEWMEPVIARLEIDLQQIRGAEARLTFLAARHLHELEAAPGMHQLIYRELHWESYYGSELHRLNQRYTRLVNWIVKEGMAAGELRADADGNITRDMMFGAFQHIGWRTTLNNERRPLDVEAVAAQLVSQIYGGIRAQGPAVTASPLDDVLTRLESVAARLEGSR